MHNNPVLPTERVDDLAHRFHNDPLMGFGDHGKLIADLTTALAPGSPPAIVAVFELVGWHDYRRVCGEQASDELIVRCATQFAQVLQLARCYRSRQDELCALVTGPINDVTTMLFAAEERLTAEGGSSLVTACFGIAVLPDDAADPVGLLILADQRIYLRTGAKKPRERRTDTRQVA